MYPLDLKLAAVTVCVGWLYGRAALLDSATEWCDDMGAASGARLLVFEVQTTSPMRVSTHTLVYTHPDATREKVMSRTPNLVLCCVPSRVMLMHCMCRYQCCSHVGLSVDISAALIAGVDVLF